MSSLCAVFLKISRMFTSSARSGVAVSPSVNFGLNEDQKLPGAYIPGAFNHGFGDPGQCRDDDHRGERDVEPAVHEEDTLDVIKQAGFEVIERIVFIEQQ